MITEGLRAKIAEAKVTVNGEEDGEAKRIKEAWLLQIEYLADTIDRMEDAE